MFETKKTLIVVYKDELLMNQLKKLVETNDDTEDTVVGTKDNSISIVSWTEKVWMGNKKAGNIEGKILFLGDIKGTDKLIPVIDVQYDESGVKYGWAGNQAVLFAEPKALSRREAYDVFLDKLSKLPVPDFLKADMKAMDAEADSSDDDDDPLEHKKAGIFGFARKAASEGAEKFGKVSNKIATKSEEVVRNRRLMKRQMLFYGVVKLYYDGLEEFMNL